MHSINCRLYSVVWSFQVWILPRLFHHPQILEPLGNYTKNWDWGSDYVPWEDILHKVSWSFLFLCYNQSTLKSVKIACQADKYFFSIIWNSPFSYEADFIYLPTHPLANWKSKLTASFCPVKQKTRCWDFKKGLLKQIHQLSLFCFFRQPSTSDICIGHKSFFISRVSLPFNLTIKSKAPGSLYSLKPAWTWTSLICLRNFHGKNTKLVCHIAAP